MHWFIPSPLRQSYPFSRATYTESCGEAVVVKRLAFSTWKANPTEGKFHEKKNKMVDLSAVKDEMVLTFLDLPFVEAK